MQNRVKRGTREARRRRAERLDVAAPSFRLRAVALLAFLGVFLLGVIWSAFQRQVVEREFLQQEGAARYLRAWEIPARRGMILDRNGEPLAVSSPVASVWTNPRVMVDHPQAIAELADAIGVERSALMQRIEERRRRAFVYLKRRIGPRQAQEVERIKQHFGIRELGMQTEYRRFYPGGEIFGHVIGFTNVDDEGIEGIELAFDAWLGAEPGLRHVIKDGRHRLVAEVERIRAPRHGKDLVLSLDRRLQFLAYRELKRAVKRHRAKSASAVVLDVASGEILAMVNQPAYNPNGTLTGASSTRRNRALTDVLEPGSTVKPLVVAAALERDLVGAATPIDTSPGFLKVGRNRVRDVRNYGLLDTTGIITKSSNVGVVKLALRMDRQALWGLYDRVGFGRPTGVKFPGEVTGRFRHFDRWSNFEHATMAFGYGLSVTPLQLARAYSVIAADGLLRPVSLLKQEETPQGERILSTETARTVRTIMETVVSAKGTAKRAAIEGYRVAGKTGTAKKAVRGGYARGRYQAVFAGMAPASRPRFVMVVMVDEPGGKHYYGGLVAAPVFARVMQGALRLYNVPPDDPSATMLLAEAEESR
jgi:cell division protein FtsI (penicillin-binding protein 3)